LIKGLKGKCQEIFCFRFFSLNSFPLSPIVSQKDRFEFFRKFAEIYENFTFRETTSFGFGEKTEAFCGNVPFFGKVFAKIWQNIVSFFAQM